jgi:antitoxin component of MazEF toxin-antitoxin module
MKNTNTKSSTGKTANLQYSDEITVEPTSNNIVNFKVTSRKGDQEAEQCEEVAEVAAISIQFMGLK